MNFFAGIVRFDGAPSDRRIESQFRRIVHAQNAAPAQVLCSDGALFVQRIVGAQSQESVVDLAERPLFVASARLDNRSELAAALRISFCETRETDDAELLRRMLDRWGADGVARCVGAFVFAHWEPATRRLTLGRDCLGRRPLFYHRGRDFVAFAMTLNMLLALPEVPRELDEIVLADYLALNLGESRRTFYRGVERIPSRTIVVADRTGSTARHYWAPDLERAPRYRREQDYVEHARELFDRAVADATAHTARVAVAASGGLDSSAVAATVARLGRAAGIHCYSVVPAPGTDIDVGPFKYIDERPKLDALARLHPALEMHFLAPQGPHRFEEDDTHYFARASLPVLGPPTAGLYGFLHDAVVADGHRQLLTGHLGNFGLTWSGDFSLLALLAWGRFGAFASELSALARETRRTLARTLARELVLPAAPAALRRLIYRLAGRNPDDIARYSALNPAFIATHRLTRAWRRQGFDPWFSFAGRTALVRAYQLFDFNQFARDGAALSLDRRGLEICDPHADRWLLEFVLAVPEPMFRRNGIARSFARSVLADRLPPEILNERRRGVQDGNWFRRLDRRRHALARNVERLEGSATVRRLIDLPRVKRLIRQWPGDEHAAEKRLLEFRQLIARAVHVGNFIRWVEGGNA